MHNFYDFVYPLKLTVLNKHNLKESYYRYLLEKEEKLGTRIRRAWGGGGVRTANSLCPGGLEG